MLFKADKKFMWERIIPQVQVKLNWRGVSTKKGEPCHPLEINASKVLHPRYYEGEVSEIYADALCPRNVYGYMEIPGFKHIAHGLYISESDPDEVVSIPIKEVSISWDNPPEVEYVRIVADASIPVVDVSGNPAPPSTIIKGRRIYYAGKGDMCFVSDKTGKYAISPSFPTGIKYCGKAAS